MINLYFKYDFKLIFKSFNIKIYKSLFDISYLK